MKNHRATITGFLCKGPRLKKTAWEWQGAEKYRKPLGTRLRANAHHSLTKYAQVIHRRSPCKDPNTALSCIPNTEKALHIVLVSAADLE